MSNNALPKTNNFCPINFDLDRPNDPRVHCMGSELKLTGLAPNSQVSIEHYNGAKSLHINGKSVQTLDPDTTYSRIAIQGGNLSRDNTEVKGEPGIKTVVEFFNAAGTLRTDFDEVFREPEDDRNAFEKMADKPVTVTPKFEGWMPIGINVGLKM